MGKDDPNENENYIRAFGGNVKKVEEVEAEDDGKARLRLLENCGKDLKYWYLAYFILYSFKYIVTVYQFCRALNLPGETNDPDQLDMNTEIIKKAE